VKKPTVTPPPRHVKQQASKQRPSVELTEAVAAGSGPLLSPHPATLSRLTTAVLRCNAAELPGWVAWAGLQ